MYRYSETRKHHLTRELIEHDLRQEAKGSSMMLVFAVAALLLGAVVATGFIRLIAPLGFGVREDALGLDIAVAVVWVIAVAFVIRIVAAMRRARKSTEGIEFHVTKRRLDTIAREEHQGTHYYGGHSHAVYRDVFYFEGMGKYFPNSTEMAMADEGDEYYVVTRGAGSTHPLRIYRADAYIWRE